MIQKLITVVHLYYGEGIDVERDECLKWLEKQIKKLQGNSNIGVNKEEKVDNADTTDNTNKVEPKFKDCDWIVYKDAVWKVCNISLQNYYELLKTNNEVSTRLIEDVDENAHLWTIKDAKDGDILVSSSNKAFIYNGNFNKWNVGAYCGLNICNEFTISDRECNWCCNCNIKPATEKQRIVLFDEMTSLNYIWNPETKEINRLDEDEGKISKTIKVNDILDMLFLNVHYELIGARTGKKLYQSWRNTNIDKYKDLDVITKCSIAPSFRTRTNSINAIESVHPILLIYVTGL